MISEFLIITPLSDSSQSRTNKDQETTSMLYRDGRREPIATCKSKRAHKKKGHGRPPHPVPQKHPAAYTTIAKKASNLSSSSDFFFNFVAFLSSLPSLPCCQLSTIPILIPSSPSYHQLKEDISQHASLQNQMRYFLNMHAYCCQHCTLLTPESIYSQSN